MKPHPNLPNSNISDRTIILSQDALLLSHDLLILCRPLDRTANRRNKKTNSCDTFKSIDNLTSSNIPASTKEPNIDKTIIPKHRNLRMEKELQKYK